MPNKLKELVSKKKIRYVQEGFDLDLTYITHRIIAMGFPAQSWEGIYRNHIDDVVNFFQKKHSGHYQIYNLCNERHIDEQKFEQYSINHCYPFNDHNPPMFTQMIECCKTIEKYLALDENNVVAIQCKAGKGRTGVIVCGCLVSQMLSPKSATDTCLLSQDKRLNSATDVLKFYGDRRTTNGKGVTIPSQIRYIYYFDHYLRNKLEYESITLKLTNVALEEMPTISGNNYEIQFIIYIYNEKTKQLEIYHTSQFYEAKKDGTRTLNLSPDGILFVKDDLKVQFVLKSKFGKKENLCHLWLNTFFIVHRPQIQSFYDGKRSNLNQSKSGRLHFDNTEKPKIIPHAQIDPESSSNIPRLSLQKHEIDKACKDINSKTFPQKFAITFNFENAPKLVDPPTPNTNYPPQPKPRTKNSDIKRTYTDRDQQSSPIQRRASRDINDPPDDHSESSESSSNSHDDLND